MKAKSMPAGLFKTHCLALMDEVQANRQPVVITKRGKPVAKLVPADDQPDPLFNFMKGKLTIAGDVITPAIAADEWNLPR